MATTVTEQPVNYHPAYNPIWFGASSTKTAETNFKFIFEVFLEGSVTVDRTFKVNAHPTSGKGFVDIHKYIETQITSDISISDTNIEQNPNSIIQYSVKVGEEYNVAGVLTEFLAQNTVSGQYSFNGAINFNDYVDFDNGVFTYPFDAATPVSFLTNAPTTQNISLTESAFLYGLIDTSNSFKWLHVTTKDSTGATNGEFQIVYDNATIPATTDQAIRCPAGINLNEINGADITTVSGATPILDSDVDSYEIYAESSTNAATSTTYTFNVVDRDCKYTPHRIYFLNELGGFDAFTFDLISKKRWSKTEKEYKREAALFNTDGTVTYSKGRHQKRPFYSSTKESMVLNTDWISEAESVWLRELFDSPEIYIIISSELVAISKITEVDYEEKTSVVDGVHNLTFTVEYSWDNVRQRC